MARELPKKRFKKKVDVYLSEPQGEVLQARTPIIAQIAGQGGGKTNIIGLDSGMKILNFPEALGFIAANTHEQLSGSTLTRAYDVWDSVYGLTLYSKKDNPNGHFVVGVRPPRTDRWKKPRYHYRNYNSVITFWNGATVFIGSLSNYKVHDGKQFAWAHLDETKDTKEEALTTVILGRLRQYGLWYHVDTRKVIWAEKMPPDVAERQGFKSWCPLYIHTSPAEGNVDWLVKFLGIAPYEREIRDAITQRAKGYFSKVIKNIKTIIYSAYHNEDNLRPGFLQEREEQMTEAQILKFIHGYPFAKNGGEWLNEFDRFKHTGVVKYNIDLPIHMTWDFNSTPYMTLLLSHVQYVDRYWDPVEKVKYAEFREGCEYMQVLQIRYFKEYCLPDPKASTECTCEEFLSDFKGIDPEVFVYGDSSGNSRMPGLGSLTNYKIIEGTLGRELSLPNGWKRVKAANVMVNKRRNLLNRILAGKVKEVEVIIDEDCKELIRDCEFLLVGKDGEKHKEKKLDKNGIPYESIGHTSDAMEYQVCYLAVEFLNDF